MKILLTGASSFSGMWFAAELIRAGHSVTAAFRYPQQHYQGLRLQRTNKVLKDCLGVFDTPFGEESFLRVISERGPWDLFCHHAADVNNYKSPDFDVAAAVANNGKNILNVLTLLKKNGCKKILLTGSVFEQREGKGSDKLRAVSPYGLSKGLTFDLFAYYCEIFEMMLGKFVIPNPFGPYEEMRFTSYLIQTWFDQKKAVVSFPEYIRDNIPITLLAKSYAAFADKLLPMPGFEKINPSYYVLSQGAFTKRFAEEMRPRLSLPCDFELKEQKEFTEPKIRVNTETLDPAQFHWNEVQFWDELAGYYQSTLAGKK